MEKGQSTGPKKSIRLRIQWAEEIVKKTKTVAPLMKESKACKRSVTGWVSSLQANKLKLQHIVEENKEYIQPHGKVHPGVAFNVLYGGSP